MCYARGCCKCALSCEFTVRSVSVTLQGFVKKFMHSFMHSCIHVTAKEWGSQCVSRLSMLAATSGNVRDPQVRPRVQQCGGCCCCKRNGNNEPPVGASWRGFSAFSGSLKGFSAQPAVKPHTSNCLLNKPRRRNNWDLFLRSWRHENKLASQWVVTLIDCHEFRSISIIDTSLIINSLC